MLVGSRAVLAQTRLIISPYQPKDVYYSSMSVLAHFDSGLQNFLDGGVCCFILFVVSPFVFWSYLVQEKCYLYI